MGILDTLAAVANTALPQGVNWAEQTAGGQYANWQESIAAYRTGKANGYFADLAQASNQVRPYMNSIGIDPMLAVKSLYDQGVKTTEQSIEANKTLIEQAISAGWSITVPILFDGKRLREALQGHMALLYTGYLLHQTGMIFQLRLSDQAIKDHADSIARGYKQMYYLIQTGALEPLRLSPVAVKGLGGGPALGLPIVIAIGSIIALGVLCAAFVAAAYLVSVNVTAYLACRDLVAANNPNAVAFCQKATQPDPDIVKGLNPLAAAKPIVDSILFYGAIGLGIYALVTFMPMIVGQVGESKRKWKEYA